MSWIAEEKVIWVLPSGEQRPGRIAVGTPEYVKNDEGEHAQCAYALDGILATEQLAYGDGSLQALFHAMQMLGFRLYWLFALDGVRVLYPPESTEELDLREDPQAATSVLVGILGPLVRAHGNLRGPADPDGKLAELEALLEKRVRELLPED